MKNKKNREHKNTIEKRMAAACILLTFVLAEADIKRTLESAGPTHGVHAKLNVNPMTNAVHGDIARASRWKGRRCSWLSILDLPKIPS